MAARFTRSSSHSRSADARRLVGSLWQYPSFRHSQRMITGVWGACYLAEAVAKVIWVLMLPFDTAYLLNQVVPLVISVALMGWTIWYANRTRRAGEQRAAAAGVRPE